MNSSLRTSNRELQRTLDMGQGRPRINESLDIISTLSQKYLARKSKGFELNLDILYKQIAIDIKDARTDQSPVILTQNTTTLYFTFIFLRIVQSKSSSKQISKQICGILKAYLDVNNITTFKAPWRSNMKFLFTLS